MKKRALAKSKVSMECDKEKKISVKDGIRAWEKERKDDAKGTSYFWKTTFEVVRGVFSTAWLTAL